MAATLADIRNMYFRGNDGTNSHMIVKCDTFDYEDYPVYVPNGTDPREVSAKDGGRTMECYSYALGWEVQSVQHRAQNWDF